MLDYIGDVVEADEDSEGEAEKYAVIKKSGQLSLELSAIFID